MLPGLVRHAFFPLHELIVGRATCAYVDQLERSQWAAPVDLSRLQAMKLQRLLQHAFAHVPFYERCMVEAGVDPYACDPFTALSRLQLLSRDEVRQSLEDMTWRRSPGGLFRYNTGGSTGEPLIFYIDRRRQAYDQAARIRTHRWFGVNIGDPEVYLWGGAPPTRWSDTLKKARDRLFNQYLLDAFHMSASRIAEYAGRWNRIRPASLFGYPSSIRLLVDHVRASRHKLHCKRLKAVFVTGEVCLPQDRAAIEEYFQVPVADGYGSRDGGFVAHQCPKGRMHVTAENVLVEIVEDEVPRPTRECGEIVLTHLDAYGMPLIRYRTGDRGRLLNGRCPCGRGLPLMDVVQGRVTDELYLPDGTAKHALSVIYPLRETAGVRQFRVVQHEDYSVTAEVVTEPGANAPAELQNRIRRVLDDAVPVEVRLVQSLPLTRVGKFRHVISHARPRSATAGPELKREAVLPGMV